MKEEKNDAWFHQNVIWVGLCSKVILGNPRKAFDQEQNNKNKRKRLMSADARTDSQNLGGSDAAEKQKSRGDIRVYWGIALTRGVIGVTTFTDTENEETFPGETPQGIYRFIDRLPLMLNKMLGRNTPKPRTVFF